MRIGKQENKIPCKVRTEKRMPARLSCGLFAVLILLSTLLLPAPVLAAEDAELKSVKIAVDDSEVYFTTDSDGNINSGYAYEYIENIAAYANWDVEYLAPASFADCLDMVRSGEADIFYDISYTEERAAWLLYTDSPMGTEDYYLYTRSDDKTIQADDLASLNGKRVGTTAGTVETEELRQWSSEKGINLSIIEFDSDPEKAAALRNGLIDMEYEISFLVKGDFSALMKLSGSDFYLVANGERTDLIQEANAARVIIDGVNPFFIQHLTEKYFSDSVLNRTLSSGEQEWVTEHETLRIGYMEDFLPFSDTDENGNVNGIVKDIVPAMLRAVELHGISVDYVGYEDNDRMYADLDNGILDAVFPVYDNVRFSTEHKLLITSDVVDVSADLICAGSYTDETTKTIAVNRYNRLQECYTQTHYPEATIIYFDSTEECLRAVEGGKVGSTVVNGLRSTMLLSEGEYDNLTALRLTDNFGLCFAVARGNSSLLSIFNRAIISMDSGTAFNYVYGYLDNDEPDTIAGYVRAHKTLILSTLLALLLVILCATVLVVISLKRSQRVLSEANRAKTSFLFNMSHDIRTPMNAILGFTNMAQCSLDDRDKVADCLEKTKQAGNLLLTLINSILEMSRIEAGKAELDEKPLDMQNSFDSFRSTVQQLAVEKNITLTFELNSLPDRYVYADTERTARVLVNLVTNAIKYTESGGWVRVKCEQYDKRGQVGYYRYTVQDNGVGMSKEFQKHIFEEFSREKTSTASGIQGSGLGLSVAKAFVDLMGGTIQCVSEQGKGTTFTVTLPFRLRTDMEEVIETVTTTLPLRRNEAEEPQSELVLNGKRVLLVEDNEMNREIAGFLLEEKGLTVEYAEDGTFAVDILREKGAEYYDFILMDIQMPLMDGYEATRLIREMYPKAKLPIIALSANAFAEDKIRSVAAGMDDHISKPINEDELFGALKKFL